MGNKENRKLNDIRAGRKSEMYLIGIHPRRTETKSTVISDSDFRSLAVHQNITL